MLQALCQPVPGRVCSSRQQSMAHSGPLPVFANKVLLQHGQAQLCMQRLWQLSVTETAWPTKPIPALYSESARVVCVDSDLRTICRD